MAMDINIPNAITGTIGLVIFMLAIAGLFLGCFWVIFKVGTILYKWLSKRKFVLLLRQKYQEWWNKKKTPVISLWEFTSEMLIDPIFYGYALYTLVRRLQSIAGYTETYPQYSFMDLLNLDMEADMQYYIVFLMIFVLWMLWRTRKHNSEMRFRKDMVTKLGDMNVKLDKLTNIMEKEDDETKSEHFDSVL